MTKSIPRYSQLVLAAVAIFLTADAKSATDWAFEEAMQAIVDQMNEGSGQAFSDAVDIDALLERVFKDVEIGDRTKAGFSQQIRRSKERLGDNIVKKIGVGYYAKLLSVHEENNAGIALVRYDSGDLRFGYHAYQLEKDDAGNIRIVDWFDYLEGFQYSEALRLSAVTSEPTAASVRSLVSTHEGSDEEFARFAEVISAYRKQDYQKFYSGSAKLTRALRRSLLMHQLTCLVSRMSRDKNLYNDAYRALADNFSDEPAVAMTLVPYLYFKGDSEEAMASLRLLLEEFGVRDAALLSLMSRTALGMGNADEASLLADEAISVEPEFEAAYWAAIDAHVRLNHHSFAVMTAKSLEEQFGKSLEAERFEKSGMYANFVKSQQYRQWQAEKQLQ
jgi:hypothetical protein